MLAKKNVTDSDRMAILDMASSKSVSQIAKTLGIDGRIVSGIVCMARRPKRPYTVPHASPPPLPFPTKDDQLKVLAKNWKESEPEAEFSLHTEKGQKVYIACYKGGVVLRVGEQKKVSLLTPDMASRLGLKLGEMAQWSMRIR